MLHPVRTLLYEMFVEPVLRLWRRVLPYVFLSPVCYSDENLFPG